MQVLGGGLANITQIPTRSHSSLQNLSADDHTQYALGDTNRNAGGVFFGLAAALPASPKKGNMYIATDTGKVYFCIADGAWQSYPSAIRTANGTQGDIIYFNGTDWVVLNAGTAGQLLSTGGAGANPSWGAPSFVKGTENFTLATHNATVTSTGVTLTLPANGYVLAMVNGQLVPIADGQTHTDTIDIHDGTAANLAKTVNFPVLNSGTVWENDAVLIGYLGAYSAGNVTFKVRLNDSTAGASNVTFKGSVRYLVIQ